MSTIFSIIARFTHECVNLLAGEFFPRQCHPLADLPVASSMLPGGKSVRNEFLLPDGKLTSAKILLGPAKPVLRISMKGALPPS